MTSTTQLYLNYRHKIVRYIYKKKSYATLFYTINVSHSLPSLSHLAHLEELHPALLLGLDALLHCSVGGDAHAAEGRQVFLAVLALRLGVGQLDDAQAGVAQAARQWHQLSQGEGHHGGRLALA